MNDYAFGNFVYTLREQKGLTQKDVARALGVTAAAVSKWETGSAKPRVEVLFQLANLLGVRPEELLAGQYLPAETVAPETAQQLQEQYAYLRRVESYDTAGNKFRRILAFLVDWNVMGLCALIVSAVVVSCIQTFAEADDAYFAGLSVLAMLIAWYLLFAARDVVFKGRSPGKRLTGLLVLDQQTGEEASPKKKFQRGLFPFLLYIDGLFLLATGRTIGDRVAHTVVVHKKAQRLREEAVPAKEIRTYATSLADRGKKRRRRVLAILLAVVLFVALVAGAALILLAQQKTTPQYQMAYTYLTESATFREWGVEEKDVFFNQYKETWHTDADGASVHTAMYGFMLGKGRSLYVVCHEENGAWAVCAECTPFA